MAWEWVAPVATSIVALGGIASAFFSNKENQKTTRLVSEEQIKADFNKTKEERRQRRLEEAYIHLVTILAERTPWVDKVYPIFTNTPEEYTMPPLEEPEDFLKKEAYITAYWSPEVRDLVQDWNKCLREVRHAGFEVGDFKEYGRESGVKLSEARKKLDEAKNKTWEADRRIRERVRDELMGTTNEGVN
ncbi:hypothetical protein [Nocardiopsis dassonvillei]|uniref:hypothetical protein n=1 Tax=Nocardiopsis dassonvillei TaxID=2014 RepID=UPI0033E9DA77